jgi:hypothetical protein
VAQNDPQLTGPEYRVTVLMQLTLGALHSWRCTRRVSKAHAARQSGKQALPPGLGGKLLVGGMNRSRLQINQEGSLGRGQKVSKAVHFAPFWSSLLPLARLLTQSSGHVC